VGETRAIVPLVMRLQGHCPAPSILLTHTTATGRATGHALFGDAITQAWLPWDLPHAVRAFLRHFRPDAGLLVETELWPNLAAAAKNAGIPLFLVNARLSARSARGYARIATLSRALLASLAGVAAQGDADAQRLSALGARDVVVTGNLKFDLGMPDAMRARGRELRAAIGDDRPVLVAASTRDGEEALVLDALARHPAALPPHCVVILVPRHPQRFDAVASLLRERGLAFARRSEGLPLPRDATFLLGDSMGEMFAYYAAADVAFVGGSLVPLGGQNLLEPIAAGTPTLVGPHTFNFAEAAEAAIAAGAALRVGDAAGMLAAAGRLLADRAAREQMRSDGAAFLRRHRGATDRLWAWLAPKLDRQGAAPGTQPW
jgi:3-deoxy-D-manno-octulosonic-acid transferase